MLDLSRLHDAIRHEGKISRRLLLAYVAALAGLPALGARDDRPKGKGNFKTNPFDDLGVASGDPDATSVVLWTRLCVKHLHANGGVPPVKIDVDWVIANDEKLKDVVASGTATAGPALGHAVHVVAKGLRPDRWYFYAFRCEGYQSAVGHTRTMPAADADAQKMRFAFASCQNYEHGYFTAYQHMAEERLDLVVHLGDYIYEFAPGNGKVRTHEGKGPCHTHDDYLIRHSQYRHTEHLKEMHRRCPWVVTWDDHEVEGNYANDKSKNAKTNAAAFLARRAAAYQAYYEMMPLRPPKPDGHNLKLYRDVTFGRLANFCVVDTRQYRTDQPNGDEFAPLNAAATSPANTLLGKDQRAWLEGQWRASRATWNVLAQQVMMCMVDRHSNGLFSMDAWTGYVAERTALVQFLADHKVKNPVVLTGDVHSAWVNELRADDRNLTTPVVATEFVCSSITSKGNGKAIPAAVFNKQQGTNPFVKFHDDQRGYVVCTVTPDKWETAFRVVSDVEKKGGTISTAATFTTHAGKPGV